MARNWLCVFKHNFWERHQSWGPMVVTQGEKGHTDKMFWESSGEQGWVRAVETKPGESLQRNNKASLAEGGWHPKQRKLHWFWVLVMKMRMETRKSLSTWIERGVQYKVRGKTPTKQLLKHRGDRNCWKGENIKNKHVKGRNSESTITEAFFQQMQLVLALCSIFIPNITTRIILLAHVMEMCI